MQPFWMQQDPPTFRTFQSVESPPLHHHYPDPPKDIMSSVALPNEAAVSSLSSNSHIAENILYFAAINSSTTEPLLRKWHHKVIQKKVQICRSESESKIKLRQKAKAWSNFGQKMQRAA